VLAGLAPTPRILVTIREQVSLAESLFIHNSKTGRFSRPSEWLKTRTPEIDSLDYDTVIGRLERAFGLERVTVLPIEMLRHDMEQYAARLSKLLDMPARDVADRLREPPRNIRKSARELAFISLRGKFLPRAKLSRYLPGFLYRPFRSYLSKGSGAGIGFSEADQESLRRRFAIGNRRLAERHAIDIARYGYRCQEGC
jgi:hypothetical protein